MYQLKNLIKKIIKPCIIAGSCQHVLIDSFVVKKVKNRLQREHLCLINYELRRIWQDIGLHHHSPVTVIVSFILYLCICLLTQQVHNHRDAIMFWVAFAECEEWAGTLIPHLWDCWLLTWTLMTIKRGEKRSPTSSNASFIWNWERHFSSSLSRYFLKEPVYFYIYNIQQACNKLVISMVRPM